MSSAANHRKRSHRSHYRTRAFTGSRQSVITPTLSKSKIAQFISLIRRALRIKSPSKAAKGNVETD